MEDESRKGNAPLKWEGNGLQLHWDYLEKYPDMSQYAYYFYWWNWLPVESRYVGLRTMYYDGYHYSLGWWFINWSWNGEVPFLSKWMRKRYDNG